MKFVNRKTCHGFETYLMIEGVPLRLSLLPEFLRSRTEEAAAAILDALKHLQTQPIAPTEN